MLILAACPLGVAGAEIFRGVDGVDLPEAGIGQNIVVRLRDFDGWLLNEIRQKRVTGEGYFKEGQLEVFLNVFHEADVRSKPGHVVTYGDLLQMEYDALRTEDSRLKKLKLEIDRRKNEIGGATEPVPPSQELEGKKKELGEWNTKLQQDLTGFNDRQQKWYAEWEAFRSWRALFRKLRQSLYLVFDDSHFTHINALNPFEDGKDDSTGITVDEFQFALKEHPDDGAEWDKLYRGMAQRVPVVVTLGFVLGGKAYTLDTHVRPVLAGSAGDSRPMIDESGRRFFPAFTFRTYKSARMAFGLGLVVVILIVFFGFAKRTEMVRDPVSPGEGGETNKFSLPRCQTAFWFFLFTAAYVFLWVVKRQTDTLTEQCLILLGISTGTMLGAAMISKPPVTAAPAALVNPNEKGTGNSFSVTRFIGDLLRDPNGEIVFYRFQTLAWTVVLGLVFVKSVCWSLQMPIFGTNELTLMGISAGTYIGFKFPESKDAKEQAAIRDKE